MKLLLFGGSGLLGRAVQRKLPGEWTAFCPTHGEYDLCEADAAKNALKAYRPDAVLNCTAFTDVDRCEKEPKKAFWVNFEAVARLSSACRDFGVPFYHIGTDYVFDGGAKAPIPEEAEPNPINTYGRSKLAGEEAALKDGGGVLRVQWLYGYGKSAFVDRILNSSADSAIKVVNDCFGIPTLADDVAKMLVHLIGSEARGLFHGACKGQASWLDFAKEIMAQAGIQRELCPVSSESLGRAAKRPEYTVLNTQKLERIFPLRPWQEALGEFLGQAGRTGP